MPTRLRVSRVGMLVCGCNSTAGLYVIKAVELCSFGPANLSIDSYGLIPFPGRVCLYAEQLSRHEGSH